MKRFNNIYFKKKQILKKSYLFIIGVGKVGSELINQINNQKYFLRKKLNLDLKIISLANTKKSFFCDQGIDLIKWKKKLYESKENMNLDVFFNNMLNYNVNGNKILIDNTDSYEIAKQYSFLLQNNINIVTCNKIACSSEYAYYNELKNLSRIFNKKFLFETNVGAGLPIINTINNLINTGDKIQTIEAILSGSLSFIFNKYNGKKKFVEIVKEAQKKGYTEPDPRIDLSGIDVKRKILIIARECGEKIEINNIKYCDFLKFNCLATNTIDEFFKKLEHHEKYFQNLYLDVCKNHQKLKFIAKYNKKRTKIELSRIQKKHPFYNVEGEDNIFLFKTTKNYPNQPLIIKGAGAGSIVTASGIFSNIIEVS